MTYSTPLDVQPARGDVGGDEQLTRPGFELFHGVSRSRWVMSPWMHAACQFWRRSYLVQPRALLLVQRKYDRNYGTRFLAPEVLLQHAREVGVLIGGSTDLDVLRDAVARLEPSDPTRTFTGSHMNSAAKPWISLRPRRAEHHRLTVRARRPGDLPISGSNPRSSTRSVRRARAW